MLIEHEDAPGRVAGAELESVYGDLAHVAAACNELILAEQSDAVGMRARVEALVVGECATHCEREVRA